MLVTKHFSVYVNIRIFHKQLYVCTHITVVLYNLSATSLHELSPSCL